MGVMTEPRSDGQTTKGDKRLDEKLSSAAELNRAEMKGLGATEENGEEIVEEGRLDENANVDFTKQTRVQGSGAIAQDRVKARPTQSDVTPRNNDVMDDVRLNNLATEGDVTVEETGMSGRTEGEDVDEENEGGKEEEEPEMTAEDKAAMREAVKDGNIELLEDLLDKPGADINMVSFQENLLMTAIRAGQGPMAEFLIDNEVDRAFSTSMVHMKETGGKRTTQTVEWYEVSCRQMAYDKGMHDVVELIDTLDGRLFSGVKPRQRTPRLRRPPRSDDETTSNSDDDDFSSTTSADDSDVSGEGQSSIDGGSRFGGGGGGDTTTPNRLGPSSASEQSKKRRLRATSGKSEATLDTSDLERGLSVSTRSRLLSEEQLDRDSGLHSDEFGAGAADREASDKGRMRKKKRRDKDREGAGTEVEGEVRDNSREAPKAAQSAAGSEVRGDQVDAGSKGTRSRSSQQSVDGANGVHDEEYETMSPSPSLAAKHKQQQQQQATWTLPPSIPVKSTKSYMALRRTTETHIYRYLMIKYHVARPLKWRKVKSAGSYATESPLWHRNQRAKRVEFLNPVASKTSAEADTPKTTTTTRKLNSVDRQGVVDSRSGLKEMDLRDFKAEPKILTPSIKKRTAFMPKSSPAIAGGAASPAGSETSSCTNINSNSSTADTDKQYPLKQKVAKPNYMKMTASSFVKRKLEPTFTNVYRSLDFTQPTESGHTLTASGHTAPSGSKRVAQNGVLKSSSTRSVPKTARTGVSFPMVTDTLLGYRQDTVHNFRNNSTVVRTPAVNKMAATCR